MGRVRVVYKPDKTVAIIHPAPNSRQPDETEKQWLERVFKRAVEGTDLEGLPCDDIDPLQLPQSREDRDAWEGEKGKGVRVNQLKAAAIREQKQKREQDKNNAINKLKAMGLTPDEIKTLFRV
jgi:uracil-DNA glycosylase